MTALLDPPAEASHEFRPRYMRRGHHLSDEGRTDVAVAYLESADLGTG